MANVELDVININTQPAEQGVTNVKGRIKELKQEMINLELQGKSNTKEFQQMKNELGDLTRAMKRVGQDAAEASTTFSNNFSNATRVIAGASAAVQTITGMMGLFGKEVDNDSKLMKTLVSAMAITSGVTAIQSGVDAFKLLTRSIKASTAAQKAFNAVSKANPYILLASAIVAAGTAIFALGKKMNGAEKESRNLAKEIEEVKKSQMSQISSGQKEIYMMDALINKAKDTTKSYKERKAAVEELNKKYPALEAELKKENGQLKINIQAYNDYRDAILSAARAKAFEDRVQTWTEKEVNYQEQVNKLTKEYNKLVAQEKKAKEEVASATSEEADILAQNLLNAHAAVKAKEDELNLAKKNLEVSKNNAKYYANQAAQSTKPTPTPTPTPTATPTAKDIEKYDEYEKRRVKAELDYVNLITDEIKYNEILLQIERDRAEDPSQIKTAKQADEQLLKISKLEQAIKKLRETDSQKTKENSISLFDTESETQKLENYRQILEDNFKEINNINEKYEEEKQLATLAIEEETARKIYELDKQRLQDQKDSLEMQFDAGLFEGNESEYYQQMADLELQQTELEQEYANKRVEIAKNEADAKKAIQERYYNAMKSITGNVVSVIGSAAEMMGQETEGYKFMKAAEATISTLAGSIDVFMGMFNANPGPLGMVTGASAAAAVVAQGMATVKQIYAVDKDKNNSSVSPAALVSLSGSYSNVRLQNGNGGQYDLSGLEQKLGNQKVYVVQSDIDSAHDRRVKVRQNSTF